MDWAEACQILGISESATDTEIKEQYIYKAQLLHPDKNQDKPENIRRRAESELALVNQAYRFATNPNNNPYRIPPKLSIEPGQIRFKDISPGEKRGTTLIIKNTGGPYTSIWIDNQPSPWLNVTGVKSITKERLPLEVALECTGTGEQGKQFNCDLLVKLENENTHVVDCATVKIELYPKYESLEQAVRSKNKVNTTISQRELAPHPTRKNKPGFSFKALLVNLLAFAIIGIILTYIANIFFELHDVLFRIVLILYAVIALGVSIRHGINFHPKTVISNKNNKVF